MSPWDLIVWAIAASISVGVLGCGTFVFLLLVNIARGKI